MDNLNTTKSSVRYVDASFVGRTISFQDEPVFVLFVGTKEATGLTLKLMSNRPKRFASRRPSRPNPGGVVAPVARVKLELMFDIVVIEVTDPGFTLPLLGGAVLIYPNPALPVTVMRTGGRK
jgi:hypothetical protein